MGVLFVGVSSLFCCNACVFIDSYGSRETVDIKMGRHVSGHGTSPSVFAEGGKGDFRGYRRQGTDSILLD
jgi:hypothetical protein